MATLREIRRRISGVKSTQKITKAMKMVAAAKLRRAQDAVVSARPYARKMQELLRHLAGKVDLTTNAIFAPRPVNAIAVIVVTSDRGLCGAFNGNLMKAASAHILAHNPQQQTAAKVKLVCVGRKGFDFFSKRNFEIVNKHIGIFGNLQFTRAQSIIGEVVEGFLKGEYDRVDVVYNEFKSIMHQRIVVEQILPFPGKKLRRKRIPAWITFTSRRARQLSRPSCRSISTSRCGAFFWNRMLPNKAHE